MTREIPWEEFKQYLGKEIGVTEWMTVTQERIDAFAESTEDRQWIHTDKNKAKLGPFRTTIAHSFLTLSLLPYFNLHNTVLPAGIKMMVNYGLNRVRFINPVLVDSKIRNRAVLKDITEKPSGGYLLILENTVEIEGQEKPAMVAELLALIFI
jgi:acyl dehydratase